MRIYAYVDTDDAAYFVMELMSGGELFDKIVELGRFVHYLFYSLKLHLIYVFVYCEIEMF